MTQLQLRNLQAHYLNGLNHTFEAGAHWVFCGDSAAASELTELCSGLTRPKRGRVLLNEQPVASRSHPEIGVMPPTVALPHVPVARLMDLTLQLRGATQSAQQLLSEWELSELGSRFAATLDALSARRVALLLALAIPKPKLLALHGVFQLGLPRDRVLTSLTRAAANEAVVLLTADRSELDGTNVSSLGLAGASAWLLQPSRLVAPDQLPQAHDTATTHTLSIMCSDARALSEVLSRDPRISALRLDERTTPHRVEVSGASAATLASAVTDAALQRNVDIRDITPDWSPLFGTSPSGSQTTVERQATSEGGTTS